LLIVANPKRISELGVYQLAWSALYLLAALAIVQAVLRRAGRGWVGLSAPHRPAARMLAVFVVVSFAAWMVAFSIHRYLIALELLAPLALWLLARHALPAASAEKWAAGLIAVCAVIGCKVAPDWSHEGWTRRGFTVEAPPMEQPSTATVLLMLDEPQAWRIPFLPEPAAYIGIANNFPASPGYEERTLQIAAKRGGKVYALFPGAQKQASDENRVLIENAQTQLRTHGWQLQAESCAVHASYIGTGNYPFYWCEVRRLNQNILPLSVKPNIRMNHQGRDSLQSSSTRQFHWLICSMP
jgi:hypothetical protein